MGSRRLARTLAFQAIYSWDVSRQPLESFYDFSWISSEDLQNLDEETSLFARLLIGGTVENLGEVDVLISENLKNWEIGRINKVDLAILRLSTYSLKHLKDIPPRVTIDEAVDLSKKFASEDSYRFVNGVLDGIKRNLGL